MGTFFRDYGLIAVLICFAVGGYFLLGDEREDVLASSLDALGSRLTALVDDDEAREQTELNMEAFKAAVAANEVAPEEVEQFAANVLNLSASGAKLSAEDADMVWSYAFGSDAAALPLPDMADAGTVAGPEPSVADAGTVVGAAPPVADAGPRQNAPRPPAVKPRSAPERPWSPDASKRVGARVAAMVDLAERMRQGTDEDAQALANHVQFVVMDGLKVVMDSVVTQVWQSPRIRDAARDLDRERVVIWDSRLAEERRRHAENLREQRDKIEEARRSAGTLDVPEADQIRQLEKLVRLQEMGLLLRSDPSVPAARIDSILNDVFQKLEREIESAVRDGATGIDAG
jgi:hypothetical protein